MSLFGMGWDVESSGAGDVVPPVFGSSLGLGCVTGQSWGIIVHTFQLRQGVRVIFGGHGLMRQRRMVSFRGGQGGSRTAPTGEGSPGSARGCAFRKDGFLPPQERRMGGGSVGPPPLDPSRASRLSGSATG